VPVRTNETRGGRRAGAGALALALACALGGAGAASAQDATSCGAPACLGVALSPELRMQLEHDGATPLDVFEHGLTLSYEGAGPMTVRLVAARYDNGRLVRYGVTERAQIMPGDDVAIEDAAMAVHHAFEPATHRDAEIAPFGGEGVSAVEPISLQAFVGNVPPTDLTGEATSGLLPADADASAYDGSIGVLLLEPEDAEHRDGAAAASLGVIVRLDLVKP